MIISADPEGPRAVPARSALPKELVQENPNVRVVIHPLRTGTVRAPTLTDRERSHCCPVKRCLGRHKQPVEALIERNQDVFD